MTTMVAKSNRSCAQVASLSVQEKGSRNKRKFRADPPLSDPCKVLSLSQSGCQGYEFSAEKYEVKPVHGEVSGCDMCGVNEDHSDDLTLDLGLPTSTAFSDAGSSQPTEEGEADELHDADWSDLTETQLEELVLSNLDAICKSAIKDIISNGYTEEVATRAVLRSGLCYYGNKDIVCNIVDNTLAYLRNGQEVDPSREPCFEDLQQLEKYVLVELVCILQEVRPFFSTGDAMWCLLLCDMNVSHACAMDGDSLSSFMIDGVSNASRLTATQPEFKPEAVATDANPPAPSKPTPTVASTQGPHLGKDSFSGSLNFNKPKTSVALSQITPGKESSPIGSVSGDKPFKATATRQINAEDKSVVSRKVHSNSTKRESILRQKSFHLEKNLRTYDTKGASRAAKLNGLDGLILDRKMREAAGINLKNASLRMKAIGADVSMSEANATLSLSTNSMLNSSLSSSYHDMLPTVHPSSEIDKPPAVNSQPFLSAADTELSLSLPTKSNSLRGTLSSNTEVPNCSCPVLPYDKTIGQWVPQDKKDEMILKLYPRLRELQNQLHEWTEWANQKVMQAARRLSKDKAELKMLRQEKEEVERLKKEKRTLEENTMKKLSEMENALSKASGQVARANSAVLQLGMENTTLRQKMEAAKLRAAESSVNCEEAKIREKMTLVNFQSWEKQKSMFEEELAAERCKFTQLQNAVENAMDHHLQLEGRWKQEEKLKDELLAQAESIRKEREDVEASAKSMVKSKAEGSLKKYKDDIQMLEKEISELRLKTDSSKIAALKRGIELSNTKSESRLSEYGGVKRERECVMCLSEEMSVVFLPCAHQVVCTTCNDLHAKQGMKDCPSCRSTIQRRISVRYARP